MTNKKSEVGFVVLVATLSSLGATSIDAVLPALSDIGATFGVAEGNALQQIIGILFLGMTIGQLFYGPLSDRYGRRPVLFIGMAVFVLGCLISILANSLAIMLVGRFLQGAGAAALRIVPMAAVRDQYEGAAMSRIMSLVMAVFIIVPCLAPMFGQGILSVAGWQAIFWVLLTLTCMVAIWVWLYQPETLPPERRSAGGLPSVYEGLAATLTNNTTRKYTIVSGLIMGAFMGYVMSAEQIYRDIYETGDLFALYFTIAAASIGVASIVNARLMHTYRPKQVCWIALFSMFVVSSLAFIADIMSPLSMSAFMIVITAVFFCTGLMIGNMNAIALQPLGHIAGLANSAISFLSGCIAMVVGAAIGAGFNLTVQPLLIGFFTVSLLSLLILVWENNEQQRSGGHLVP